RQTQMKMGKGECITRYLKRKEKEKAPVGSLTALAIDKQKEIAEGLIKA
ncbi:6512_t:CDS:2, partial [Funneliformis caledonium]